MTTTLGRRKPRGRFRRNHGGVFEDAVRGPHTIDSGSALWSGTRNLLRSATVTTKTSRSAGALEHLRTDREHSASGRWMQAGGWALLLVLCVGGCANLRIEPPRFGDRSCATCDSEGGKYGP
jgi:hypothetical protein